MNCPRCKTKLNVYGGKRVKGGYKRYRKCPGCKKNFTSTERYEPADIVKAYKEREAAKLKNV